MQKQFEKFISRHFNGLGISSMGQVLREHFPAHIADHILYVCIWNAFIDSNARRESSIDTYNGCRAAFEIASLE